MRGFLLGVSISLAFVIGVLSSSVLVASAGAAGLPGVAPAAPAGAEIERWEYICYRAELSHKLVEVANQAGEEGWEMVGTDGQGTRPAIWCFKRRKPSRL